MKNVTPMITSSGERYDIPDDQREAFAADFGDAAQQVRRYRTDDGDYDIPAAQAADFVKDFPNARPLRTLQFAGGKTRSFDPEELQKFLAEEYVTSPDYQADRDEDVQRQREKDEAERRAYYDSLSYEDKLELVHGDAMRLRERFREENEKYDSPFMAGLKGGLEELHAHVSAGMNKVVTPWSSKVSGLVKEAGLLLSSFGADSAGDSVVDVGRDIDKWTNILFRPDLSEEESKVSNAVNKGVGVVSEIGSWWAALKAGGPYGIAALTMSANANSYVDLYDTAIERGASPEEAGRIATLGGMGDAAITLGFAAAPVHRIAKAFGFEGAAWAKKGVTEAVGKGWQAIKRAMGWGAGKQMLANAAVSAAEMGTLSAASGAFDEAMHEEARGEQLDWDKIADAAKEHGGEGAMLGAFLALLPTPAKVRETVKAAERTMSSLPHSAEGREIIARNAPDALADFLDTYERGGAPSRKQLNDVGIPDSAAPTAADRVRLAKLFEMGGYKSKDLRTGKLNPEGSIEAEVVSEGPAPAEPGKGEVVPVEPEPAKAPEKPVEPVKPPEEPVKPKETSAPEAKGKSLAEMSLDELAELPIDQTRAELKRRMDENTAKQDEIRFKHGKQTDADANEVNRLVREYNMMHGLVDGDMESYRRWKDRTPRKWKDGRIETESPKNGTEGAPQSEGVAAESALPEVADGYHAERGTANKDMVYIYKGHDIVGSIDKDGVRYNGVRFLKPGEVAPWERQTEVELPKPPAETPKNGPVSAPQTEGTITPPKPAEAPKAAEPAKTDEETYRDEYRRRKEIAARMDELAKEWAERTGNKPLDANFGDPKRVGEEYARLRKELNGVQPNLLDDLAAKHGPDWAVEQERAVDGEAPAEPVEPTPPPKPVNKGKGVKRPKNPAAEVPAEPKPAEKVPVKTETGGNKGDAAQQLSAMSDEDIEKAFAEALGEKEAAAEEAPPAPAPKQVNKGKGTVPAPASEPAPVNKGKGVPRPVREDSSSREVQAIAQQFGGDEAASNAVSALHNLFGASDAAKSRAKDLGMAAPHGDTFDENVYNTARPHFQTLLDGVVKSGRGVGDFIKAVADNFGAGALPYLKRFAADMRKGASNGQQGTEGNRNGQRGGPDAANGHGTPSAGATVAADGAGGPEPAAGGAGAERGVRPGPADGQGGGGRDGVRPDGQLAGHEAAGGGGGAARGPVGNGLVPKDAGTGADAGQPSVVRAPNGNIDTRKSPPVRLTASKRTQINAQAAQLAEKPVGSLTDAEIEVLRQFTGAGGLGYRGKSSAQQKAALNQHFTDYSVVDAMWSALEKAGVPMENVLEPSAGSGNFPGRRPEKNWTLVELEPTTAKVLKHLFPGAKVMQGSYEDVKLEGLDLAISNVPFLEQRHHPDRPDIKNLHDYFFAKAIDQVKPNGVVAFITSAGTMNDADPRIRQELVSKGDVIGAFRLPRGMFKANAGTEVTTDMIFIQRRPDGVPARPENAERNAAFVESVEHIAADGVSKMRISSYYEKYPEGLLGDLREEKDKMYGGRPKLELMPSDATDLSQVRIDYKPYPVASEPPSAPSEPAPQSKYPHDVAGLDAAGVKYELSDGNGTYAQNIRMYDGVPHAAVDEFTLEGYEEGTHKAKVFEPVGGEIGKKITELQHILDDANAYQGGDEAAARRGLEAIADYEKRFGKLPGSDKALKKYFKDHGEQHYLMELTAAANPDAAVWREKVRHEGSGKKQADESSSLIDQALASEDAHGEIDMGSDRCKVSPNDFHDLLESGYSLTGVGTNGKPILQNNVLFESGNIYAKIDFQKKLKAAQPKMAAIIDRQIERLEKALPTPKVFDAIPFNGSEDWVMPSLMESGIHVVEDMSDAGIREFHVTCPSLLTNDEAAILSRHMSGRKLLDKKDDESDEMYLRREREAESSLTDIYAKVRGRIAEDPERVHKIEKAFNERFNGYVKPDFSKAEYLIADTVKHFADAGFPLRPNQKRWVTQALIEGTGINAHDVGGGKTMSALALAHALKARGVAKKPMFVVPAKTINTSWLNSKNGAQILFPGAKIVNLNNLPAETRARQLFELANSNADFVFISHEGFESIQLPPDAEAAALNEFANSLIDATGDRREAMERDRLEAYIAQVAKEERDTRLTFDKLGVDCIIVDEAHNYKNVGVSAPMERQGLGKRFTVKKAEERGKPMSIMSHRAHDFRFKADWISDHNNGRNVFLLTATPTPNKPIELYTMLRHLGRRVFEEYGINNDRDFAHMFFSTGLRPVISTSGGTKNKEMITGLTNVYALKDIMGRYIDRIPMEVFAQHGIRLPKEKVEIRFVDMSSDMEMVQNEIIDRVREASGGGWDKPQKGADTVIGAFMNGRDAAVSPYVYGGPHAHVSVADRSHDPRTDKIEYAVQYATHEVARGMKDGEDPRCVLIFTDVMGGKDGKPSVPEDIKESLIRRGFDPKEIAIVTGSVITNPKTGREIQASGKKAIEMKGELADLFAPKRTDPKTGRPEKPKVKVMIGSTSSIGEGLNLDTWTSLAIHLDVPLTPGAIRQRRGRNIRFNNEHDEAKTVFLMTRGSFDQLSYGLVAKKQGWNSAIWDDHTGDTIPVDDDAAGGGINPRQIIIECERDPVRKQQMRVEFDMEARQNAIDQAREAVQSFADRIATQRRNAGTAQNRADERSVMISKSLREKAEMESKLPTIEKEIETARADLAEDAPEQAKELAGLIERAAEAKAVLDAAKDAVHAASIKDFPAAEAALDAAKKANGAAKEAVTQYIETLPKELQPFARVYRNKVAELAKAKDDISARDTSVEWSKGIIANAERDVKAANARAAELAEQSKDAEQALKDAIEARDALGKEWYDDYGTEHQRFKFEKASLAAEMEARNSEEDSLDWMDENQTLDAMPAPASTGSRPLNRGKLPDARPFGASGTAKPKQTTSKSDIFRLARELFPELKITNKGTYHRRGVLGWLEVENRVIRTIDPRGVGELCHELGHAVSRLGARVAMPKDARTEFISLGIDLYGAKRPAGGYAAEGFAEFVRGFLCDYDLAQDYPNAHKWFFEDFGGANEEFVERLYRLRDKIMEYVNMAPEHAVRAKWDHARPMSASELPFIAKLRRYDFKTKWVDSNWPIMRAMKRLSVDYNFHDKAKTPAERADLILNHPYMLATFFQGSALRFAEGDALNGTTDLYGDPTGAGLQEILSPIVAQGGESVKEFWDFAVAMRGADYLKRGMEFGNTREELAATIRAHRSKPGFRKALDDITDWSHRVLHLLVDAGAITPDEYQQIVDANPVYVTIKRAFEEGEINSARQKGGKRGLFARKGSSRDIERPVVALIEMAAKVRAQAQQAKITQSLVDMYDRARAAGAKDINTFMVEVPNPIKRQVVWADKVKEQIGDILRARSSLTEAEIRQLVKDTWTEELSVFTTGKYRGKDNIFTVTDKTGKLRSFELFDPTVRDLMLGYGKPPELTSAGRAKQVIANVIRMGATVLNGGFSLVANPIRDAATGFHMSQYGMQVPVVSTVVGMIERLFNTDAAKTYLRLGGEMGRIYNGGQHAAAKAIADQAEASNWFVRQWKKGIFQLVGDIFSTPEMGPRIEQARMAQNFWRRQGVGDTAANFLARLLGGDLTIDFGRAGTTARRLNSVLLFFNAACRELDQLARASGLADPLPWQDPGSAQPDQSITDAKERNEDFARKARRNMAKRFWSRGAAMALFAIAAYLLNSDNEKKLRRWRELRPEYKWNNTVVDFGDGDGEAPAIRLPVPFLDGLMFQSMPIAILESFRTGDATPVKEVANLMAEQLPFSPSAGGRSWYHKLRGLIPTYAQPATDVWANENWAGNEIVPERMRRMDPRDQYSPTTTEFAKRMGEMLNTPPAQVEFLFDQYTGGMVMNAIRAVESSTAKRGAIGVNGDYSKLPIIGKLFLAPYSSSRVPGEFYDALGDLTARHNSGRVTPEELGRLKAMEDVHGKVLSENSKMRRAVLGRDDITAEEAKRLTDGYAKDTIEVIRTFNDWAKDHDFRAEGIRAAAVTLSNPGATEGGIDRDRRILSGVDLAEAQAQLRIHGKAKGWSRDTVNKRLRFLANRW